MQQRDQLASMPEPPLPKEKGTELLSRSPHCEKGESQGEQEPHLGKRERKIRARAWEGKGVDFTAMKGKFQGGEGGQAKRTSLGEVEGGMSG